MQINDDLINHYRGLIKDSVRGTIDFSQTDQNRGLAPPPPQKPCRPGQPTVELPARATWKSVQPCDLEETIADRASRRKYKKKPILLEELAFLLWATQGVRRVLDSGHAFRTVPSAGCRHALETYIAAINVDGLDPGLYRYLPLDHRLALERLDTGLAETIVPATLGQEFIGRAAAVFIWTAIPYRMEWRYGAASARVIALDAGHVCQNLYLACAAVGCGTCAIAAYDQDKIDTLIGVDGDDEFTIYAAPVGKV